MVWGIKRQATALVTGVSAAAVLAGAASAATIAGEYNGLTWTATSTIVGQTPTASGPGLVGGGTATYLPDPPKHSGVAALIMTYADGGRFICSGSVVGGGKSIVTAGHCVSGGGGVKDAALVNTTAYFWDYANQDDERVPFNGEAVARDVTDYFVHPEYTGEVIDQNDIAVLSLSKYAPSFAQRYELYDEGDLTGENFNVAGYGNRSAVGGAAGAGGGSTGFLREGDNRYDFRLGDDDFDMGDGTSIWRLVLGGTADYDFSYVSDFDNGAFANDASCQAVVFGLGGPFNSKYCDGGLGEREVGIAGGDSGGPGFIDGKLASVNSYGLSFGSPFGDVDDDLNSSFGEFSGYVPIFIHTDFINDSISAAIPEPGTWALMIGGFGLAGASLRRRRLAVAKA